MPMPLTHYRTLGRSGLRVSPLCLGTMTFGLEWGWGSDDAASGAILARYLDLGGNFLDTANMYTKGHSEQIIGQFFRSPARGVTASGGAKAGVFHNRDRVVLATKFFGGMHLGDPNSGGAGRKAIVDALHHSLRRLKTDYIDLYWMHCQDAFTPIEETMRALDDLVRAGKVRYIGFSDTHAWKVVQAAMFAERHGFTPVVALQHEYSLVDRTIEGEIAPMAVELGMGLTPWSPLKGGILSGKYNRSSTAKDISRGDWLSKHLNERVFGILDTASAVAAEHGLDGARGGVAKVALAWLNAKPGVVSPIFGARTLEQLEQNIASLEVSLTPEQMARLDEASKPTLNFPFEFVQNAAPFMQAGTTINGRPSAVFPLAPQNDDERR